MNKLAILLAGALLAPSATATERDDQVIYTLGDHVFQWGHLMGRKPMHGAKLKAYKINFLLGLWHDSVVYYTERWEKCDIDVPHKEIEAQLESLKVAVNKAEQEIGVSWREMWMHSQSAVLGKNATIPEQLMGEKMCEFEAKFLKQRITVMSVKADVVTQYITFM